ncbi:MAG: 16S rRNA (uracil(1498)-N(3))-methyltransferase [Bacilli bacterium]|jgi:16S rRNA (uracil1498-N3)-methyltransferase|nr:16S rRNA (uracil(1498)-N(3))-methyltransferase [Bacilli bacterium]
MMQQYMVETSSINNNKVSLSKDDLHHLFKVMRAKNYDNIIICDYQSKVQYLASVLDNEIIIQDKLDINNELNYQLILVMSLVKSDKLELIMQKASEIGVSKMIVVQTRYSNIKLDQSKIDKKLNRWHKIIKEACEQAHRNTLMDLVIKDSLNDIIDLDFFKVVAYENNNNNINITDLEYMQDTMIVIGPEGGFSKEEINLLEDNNFNNVNLKKSILRCETAAIVSCGIIANLMK